MKKILLLYFVLAGLVANAQNAATLDAQLRRNGGKGLSTFDFSQTYKQKVDSLNYKFAQLTNASNLTSGTLNSARLGSDIPRLVSGKIADANLPTQGFDNRYFTVDGTNNIGLNLTAIGSAIGSGGSGGTSITVDNALSTTSTNPISNAAATAGINTKAPLNSPNITGVGTVVTPAFGTNTQQIANTQFVQGAVSGLIGSTAFNNAVDSRAGSVPKTLTAPNGTIYQLTVDNTGALTTIPYNAPATTQLAAPTVTLVSSTSTTANLTIGAVANATSYNVTVTQNGSSFAYTSPQSGTTIALTGLTPSANIVVTVTASSTNSAYTTSAAGTASFTTAAAPASGGSGGTGTPVSGSTWLNTTGVTVTNNNLSNQSAAANTTNLPYTALKFPVGGAGFVEVIDTVKAGIGSGAIQLGETANQGISLKNSAATVYLNYSSGVHKIVWVTGGTVSVDGTFGSITPSPNLVAGDIIRMRITPDGTNLTIAYAKNGASTLTTLITVPQPATQLYIKAYLNTPSSYYVTNITQSGAQ